MSETVRAARAELEYANDRVLRMAIEWWEGTLERVAKGKDPLPWPPDGGAQLLRQRNEARERVELAAGVDPDEALAR